MCVVVCSLSVFAQERISISGTVTDKSGEPLPGVNILVKGTTTGVATDFDGKYIITVPDRNAVLEFSYIGFAVQTVTVGNRTVVDVTLGEDSQLIDEVVVVGYGTQKKVNLIGAVSAIKVDETLTSRSLTNAANGLQGLLPGLAVSQNNSLAGSEDVTLMIRGMGTVNNSAPLVVVDGMPDVNISRLNMNDIENISLLKDAASAAIYGSRAANGVILITTKSGKGSDRVSFNVSANVSTDYPTKRVEQMTDYSRYLTSQQRAFFSNMSESDYMYKIGTVDQWMALSMIDPLKYPNTDWWEWLMRDYGSVESYNLSASGSNEKSNFYISVGVQDQKGLQIHNDYARYNARFNFDYQLLNSLSVGIRFSGDWTKQVFYDTGTGGNAGVTPYDPETGYYGGVMAYGEDMQVGNPYAFKENSRTNRNRQEALGSMFLDWKPVKGLSAHLEYALKYYNQFDYAADIPVRAYNFQVGAYGARTYIGEDAGVTNETLTGYKTHLNGRLDYTLKIADGHDLSLMAGYSEEFWYNREQYTSRNNRLHSSLHEINAALTDVQGTKGYSDAEGLRSFIGRLNYVAYDKYLLEVNFRADGSSRFLPGHQYGYFPSAALGWRFSEEDFVKKLAGNWLHQGKLRASYGTLGNNDVDIYEQREVLAASNYMMGSSIVKGFVNKKMINRDLTWEVGRVTNIGLDLGFLQGRLATELDYYDRLTTDMIRPSDLSLHLTGAYSAPRKNIGDLRNRGVEVNLTWRDRKGDFSYSLSGNFSKNWTQLQEWNEFLYKGTTYVDMPYHFLYAAQQTGMIQTWNDVYSRPPQGTQGLAPGDYSQIDVNGDGRISDEDKVAYPAYQTDRPTTNFALRGNAAWKGIDFAFMLQGAAGRKIISTGSTNGWDEWNNRWQWDNRDAEWSRPVWIAGHSGGYLKEDDMSYLRLKNVQIGYSLPQKWLRPVFVQTCRIYFSGENLATLTKFSGIDPEAAPKNADGNIVVASNPLISSYSLGINIGF
jgi:TonB-linked SusC/RagA family outer membrane protein